MLMASLLSPKAISIHALREEGDRGFPMGCHGFFNFYPRPPRGGRHGEVARGFVEK